MLTRSTAHRCTTLQASALMLALALGAGVSLAGDPPSSVPKSGPNPGKPQPIATVQLKPGEIPQIKFDEPIFEFGRVPCGKDVLHDYWFTNTGNGPLEILLVKPSCGCTSTGEFDRVVQPGRKGRIGIKVATNHASGRLMKTVTVQTNVAPPGDSTILSIRGDIWKAVQAEPSSLFFGKLNVGDESKQQISKSTEITTAGGAVLTPGNLRSSNPIFTCELSEVEKGAKYNLKVTATPPFKLGSNFATIELSTGVADVPTLQVQCTLLVSPELEVTPERLLVPAGGASARRAIQIRNNGKTPLQMSNAACSNPKIPVELREVEVGRSWTVIVNVPENYHRLGETDDIVSVDTNQSEHSRITVPLVENKLFRPPVDAPPVVGDAARTRSAPRSFAPTTRPSEVGHVP